VTPVKLASTAEVKPMNHFALTHEGVSQIGLTDDYVFWVTYHHRDQIRRRDLSAVEGVDDVFVASAYDHGMVDVNPPEVRP
jgi:hypothetical protein